MAAARDARTAEGLRGDAWWARVIGGYVGMPPAALVFTRDAYGRPRVAADPPAGTRLRFSRSATRGLELLAVAWDRDVGVDVEWCGSGAIACPALSISEEAGLRHVAPSGRERARRLTWTVREAWVKAMGDGLAATARLQVVWTTAGEPRCRDPFASTSWSVQVVDAEADHVAAVVCEGCDPFEVVWMPGRAPEAARNPVARTDGIPDPTHHVVIPGGATCGADK